LGEAVTVNRTSAQLEGPTMNIQTVGLREWPDPTPEMLDDPRFHAIWNCIKSWDINVPDVYEGYCGASGNHVRAILDALGVGLGLWERR
jgi:hypothetical protein